MDPTLATALVTAFGSLIVALISLVTSITTQRSTAKAAEHLESLRREQEQRGATIDAIREGIRLIQHAKDAIRTVVESVPTSLDHIRAVSLLKTQCAEHITQGYEKHMPQLARAEGDALHDAKNIAIDLVSRFQDLSQSASDAALPRVAIRRLKRAHRRLSEVQQVLRDSLMSKAGARNR